MATEQSLMAVIRASRPSFRNRHDKVAFAVHAAFVASGYILHAAGPPAFAEDALSSTSTDEVGMENWNAVEDNYAFVYSNPEKGSKMVLVKCLVMNDELLVDVLKVGDSEPLHLGIDVGEYVEDSAGTNYSSHFKNVANLVADVNEKVLRKLDYSPEASWSEKPSSPVLSSEDDRDSHPARANYPEYPYVSPPSPGMNYLKLAYGIINVSTAPYAIFLVPPVPRSDYDDLFPGSGAGIYPMRGDRGGGSLIVGPNDPIFFGGGIRDPGFSGGPPGVPPGARFDPYGPPDVPGFEPSRFVRNPPGHGRGAHPDVHHFHNGSDFI